MIVKEKERKAAPEAAAFPSSSSGRGACEGEPEGLGVRPTSSNRKVLVHVLRKQPDAAYRVRVHLGENGLPVKL